AGPDGHLTVVAHLPFFSEAEFKQSVGVAFMHGGDAERPATPLYQVKPHIGGGRYPRLPNVAGIGVLQHVAGAPSAPLGGSGGPRQLGEGAARFAHWRRRSPASPPGDRPPRSRPCAYAPPYRWSVPKCLVRRYQP